MLGTEPSDPVVVQLLADVPVLMSGIRQIKGRTYLYLGIGRAYFNRHGGEHIYNTLTKRFPTVPLYIEPSDGVQPLSANRAAQEEASPTDTLLADPFQAGLGAWTTTNTGTGIGWRAQAFDETPLPGAEAGNLVAVAQTADCPENCDLTLTTPLDLSRYSSVTLSFDRWVDDALEAGEFLAVELGNNGAYTRLDTWTDADGDSTWHRATYVIDADQLSSAVTVRFVAQPAHPLLGFFESLFGGTGSPTPKTLAIDNVVIVPAPGAVILEHNLTVASVTASPSSVESGAGVTVRATIRNDGNASGSSETVRVYQHRSATTDPTSRTLVGSAPTGTLAAGASTTASVQITAPTVTEQTTYHYYACIGTTCTRAQVIVNPKPDEPLVTPEREVMGGDGISRYRRFSTRGLPTDTSEDPYTAGTLTLGGLTTDNGIQGFVMSGHAASSASIESFTSGAVDVLIFGGHDSRTGTHLFKTFLGKVMQLPRPHTRGGRNNVIFADAAFVAYPSTSTSNCSLTWTTGGYTDTNRTFCLDIGKGTQIETVTPLAIRGKHNMVYDVVGSQAPTMGLPVMFSGKSSGVAEGNRVTSGAILTKVDEEKGTYYTYDMNGGQESLSGDSGSPVYTMPDRNGNVRIVGILIGFLYVAGERTTVFNAWDDVMKEFDLQPIQ